MITAENIRMVEFSKAGISGYKSNEVNDFLEDTAKAFEMLEKDKAELIKKIQILADKIEEYRGMEDTLKTSIFHAQKTADNILKEANIKSERIIMEANAKSEETIESAKSEAYKALTEADDKAKSVLSEAEAKAATLSERTEQCISAELDTYSLIKDRVASFRESILKEYNHHVNVISSITSDDRAIEKQAEKIKKANEEKTEQKTEQETEDSLFSPMN